jgi:hypothetical protein
MRANEPRACEASPLLCPLDPTQIAPESLTIGRRAAAKPPASGSSGFARATRFDTTTTFTGTSRWSSNADGRILFPICDALHSRVLKSPP